MVDYVVDGLASAKGPSTCLGGQDQVPDYAVAGLTSATGSLASPEATSTAKEVIALSLQGAPQMIVEPLSGPAGGEKKGGRKWKKVARGWEAMEGVKHDCG